VGNLKYNITVPNMQDHVVVAQKKYTIKDINSPQKHQNYVDQTHGEYVLSARSATKRRI